MIMVDGFVKNIIGGTISDAFLNNPDIGNKWLGVTGSYSGSVSYAGYSIDVVLLNLSEKD